MLVSYKCKTCGTAIDKLIYKVEDVRGVIPCGNCSGFLERQITGPSSNSVQTIDNGFMVSAVEYDQDRQVERKKQSDEHFKSIFKKDELK